MIVQGFWLAERPQAYSAHPRTLGERVLAVDPSASLSGPQTQELLQDRVVLLTDAQSDSAHPELGARVRQELYKLKDSHLRPFCRRTHRPFPMAESETQAGGKTWRFVSSALVDAGHIVSAVPEGDPRSAWTEKGLSECVRVILQQEPTLLIVCSGSGCRAAEVFAGHSRFRPKMVVPHVMFSSRMDFSDVSGSGGSRSSLQMADDHQIGLLGGKALIQMGVQRELNSQDDYAHARKRSASVVEYLPLLGIWRNAMNGREVSPLEHVLDHLDEMSHLGWNKEVAGLHVSIDLNVFASHLGFVGTDARPLGCSLQELGAILTWVGRTEVCRVLHLQGQFSGSDASRLACAAEFVASLVYKLALLREEYSER